MRILDRKSAIHAPSLLVLFGAAMIAGASCRSAPTAPGAAAEPGDDGRMAWWREARFGLFIHWGLYAIPAGEWAGRTDHTEWIRTTARIPLERYERFVEQFNPVKFDADRWARMAADAGMRYVVITSKHHDGFCLFDSSWTEFDVMATPFRRDVLRELSEACRRHGLRMCFNKTGAADLLLRWSRPGARLTAVPASSLTH